MDSTDTSTFAMDVDNGERITLDSEADLDNGLFPGATVEDDGCKTISTSGVTDEAIDEDLDENGVFIGMTKILQERGLTNEAKLKAECKNFKCPQAPNAVTTCCQRCVLYNQPDFSDQESALEILCHGQGFEVLFLPKFHCELNFIEQCWGHSKRTYCQYPPIKRRRS